MDVQSSAFARESNWAASYPMAYRPPIRPPMLAPPMISTGIPLSSIYLSTPMCVIPFAPPPASTRATTGRCCRMESMRERNIITSTESCSGVQLGRTICSSGFCAQRVAQDRNRRIKVKIFFILLTKIGIFV